jgi:hypothetical protein
MKILLASNVKKKLKLRNVDTWKNDCCVLEEDCKDGVKTYVALYYRVQSVMKPILCLFCANNTTL